VLDLSSFKCGHDAPTYGLIDDIITKSGAPYSALHDIDANKPGGSIKIRIKTYNHTLTLYQERLEDNAKKQQELTRRMDEKKLELLQRKQELLKMVGRRDTSVEVELATLRTRLGLSPDGTKPGQSEEVFKPLQIGSNGSVEAKFTPPPAE
jgi:hypothetical protein